MNVEQRLIAAFRNTDFGRPSDDLWTRVVHSIDEDRAHRRRVRAASASVGAAAIALVGVALAFVRENSVGSYVEYHVFDILVTVALVVLVVVLGPAVRRFGRGYAADLWPSAPATATALIRLLDVAYALVFTGYILLTATFEYPTVNSELWTDQVADACLRIGGLVLVMGLLHAVTFVVLPFVALVDNSTRHGRRLPRWFVVLGVVFLITQVVPLIPVVILVIVSG